MYPPLVSSKSDLVYSIVDEMHLRVEHRIGMLELQDVAMADAGHVICYMLILYILLLYLILVVFARNVVTHIGLDCCLVEVYVGPALQSLAAWESCFSRMRLLI